MPSWKIWEGLVAVDVLGFPAVELGSLKFHAYVNPWPSEMVEVLVKLTWPLGGRHKPEGMVKSAFGFARTRMVREMESVQPALVVYLYQMVCVPVPAVTGLKLPAASVPGPTYMPEPGTPLVTLAVATETGPAALIQTAGNAG